MITLCEFNNFIESDLVYAEKLISVIDDFGKQIVLDNLGQLHSNYGKTIKIEGMEKYNESLFNECIKLSKLFKHSGPTTCHAFYSFENSKSFPRHFDLDDVFIKVIEGQFKLNFDNESFDLTKENTFFIPANTPHWATHEHCCLFLSFGFEKYLTEKI